MFDIVRKTYSAYKYERRLLAEYTKQSAICDGPIHLYNWWQLTSRDGVWLSRLIQSMLEFQQSNKSVALLSVFGNRELSRYIEQDIKIFCTGENVKKSAYSAYSDHMLKDKTIDLALGFEYFEDARYLRFPLWLMYAFAPTFDEQQIRERCAQIRYPNVDNKPQFAALIASHDDALHLRSTLYDELSTRGQVACPGRFHHNDDTLKTNFGDEKIAYLRNFAFNICPENANTMGYVTEKLFEAIVAGCIPIYWGSYNKPEPSIINPEAIIFWNNDGDNAAALTKIDDLLTHPAHLDDFLHQPRLLPTAEEKIVALMEQLHKCLTRLL